MLWGMAEASEGVSESENKEISRITHQKDKNHNHSFDFVIYVKKN